MPSELPSAVDEVLLGACLAVVASAMVVPLLEPSSIVRSHDDHPGYVAAPTELIEVAEPNDGLTNWGVWVVCNRAGMPWPVVADVSDRSAAVERMAVLPPPGKHVSAGHNRGENMTLALDGTDVGRNTGGY